MAHGNGFLLTLFYVGEAMILQGSHQLHEAYGIDDFSPESHGIFASGMIPIHEVGTVSHAQRKALVLEEEHLTCHNISVFGAYTPKVMRKTVSCVSQLKMQLGKKKTHNYNFYGSMDLDPPHKRMQGLYFKRRSWVRSFAEEHFTQGDYLRVTDAKPKQHIPFGLYDHTKEAVPFKLLKSMSYWTDLCDRDYYTAMIQSNFTLCPGGDAPWDFRLYEAILAGSIPVINTVENDLSRTSAAFWWDHIGFKYLTTGQVVNSTMSSAELENIATENYKLLIKYMTWIEGDQVPPEYATYSVPCLSNTDCRRDCLTQHDHASGDA